MVWERVKPILTQARELFANKLFLAQMEKAAKRYEVWMETRSPGNIAKMREFTKLMRGQLAAAAKA